MSRIDAYEYERRPRRKQWQRKKHAARPKKGEHQLAMKLFGGTPEKDKGEPFDDPIPF
jgi:hypothetical protein